MKRSGFKRPEKPAKAPKAMPKLYRQGVTGPVTLTALPKTEAKRNPHLLAMAKGKSCLLRVPGVCNNNPETTVAAHSNSHEHGKAGARKADDCYSVWACYACHSWLDQGQGAQNRQVADTLFDMALLKQMIEWGEIKDSGNAKDKAAAEWALEHIHSGDALDKMTYKFFHGKYLKL